MYQPIVWKDWMIGPFQKAGAENPCLVPKESSSFICPILNKPVAWEGKDVFNPAAVVRDGKVWLLYRAEDAIGRYAGTSRLGLACSEDGLNFVTEPEPVFYPDRDEYQTLEWEGGCEDPRLVEAEDGTYYLYYTAFDGKTAILCSASGSDLHHLKKHGPVFAKALNGKYAKLWSKSGAVVCRQTGTGIHPVKINGRYWMYWGESNIYAATSENLIDWEPVEFLADGASERVLLPVTTPRKGNYDEWLCEPGPYALLTEAGIVLIYNGKGPNEEHLGGHDTMYCGGQLLLDAENPTVLIERTKVPFIVPSEDFELNGQVMPTCFLEGLVYFNNRYFMYYGTADSKIAVAYTDVMNSK